jgi:predicted transcriptional regulator of viral defense system
MRKRSLLASIKKLGHPVFTTFELSALSGKSLSAVTQALNNLVKDGLVIKVYRGIWAEAGSEGLSPYAVIPYLLARHRAYVSFVSALHLHNMIEQIPQMITLASTSHTKIIRTKLGVFSFHQLTPKFFSGFNWYKETGKFLIAEPEKALVDSFYLSACKKKQFGHFPELFFPKSFSFKKVKQWAMRIPDPKIRAHVFKKIASRLGPSSIGFRKGYVHQSAGI